MAAPALELRPRTTVALFDAAIRLCARNSAVWALTLPAGAALVAAVFNLFEAASHRQPLMLPIAGMTAAWAFRAISQGAACHYLEALVLEPQERSLWACWAAALKRAPSLWITMGLSAVVHALALGITAGIGLLFLGALSVGYAVTMRGQGHPLALFGTAAKLLGPARHTAAFVRLCGFSMLILFANLQASTMVFFFVCNNLLGLDLTYLQRFASLDNTVWLAAMVAITFCLFEPVRAATATLLLIDGRVRMEGLDLLTTLDQLPKRKKTGGPPLGGIAAALLLSLLPIRATAEGPLPEGGEGGANAPGEVSPHTQPAETTDDWSGVYTPGAGQTATTSEAMKSRLESVISECGLEGEFAQSDLDAAGRLSTRDQGALSRLVERVERLAYDEDDCDSAATELRSSLKLIGQTRLAEGNGDPKEDLKKILARPEFTPPPPPEAKAKPDPEQGPSAFSVWWNRLWDSFFKWLRDWLGRHPSEPETKSDFNFGMGDLGLGNIVVVVVIGALLAVIAYVLVRWFKRDEEAEQESEQSGIKEEGLAVDPMSALARPPESWAGLADTLAAEGKFREAIRHLYLALLSRLHRDGAIDYDPAKSNWDYFRDFKGDRNLLAPFRELTRRFDFAWYGNVEVSQESWKKFRATCEPMLAPPKEAAVA
ncbi:MAG: DUF4129 domain-containing protein [Myxococcaceae bacterium]